MPTVQLGFSAKKGLMCLRTAFDVCRSLCNFMFALARGSSTPKQGRRFCKMGGGHRHKKQRRESHDAAASTSQPLMAPIAPMQMMPMMAPNMMPQMMMVPQMMAQPPPAPLPPAQPRSSGSDSSSCESFDNHDGYNKNPDSKITSSATIIRNLPKTRLSTAIEHIDRRFDSTATADLDQHALSKLLWVLTRVKPRTKVA